MLNTHRKGVSFYMGTVDPVYGVNNFNRSKVLTETETKVSNMLMILFGKPGFYPSIPSLGMDINQYLYKFEDEINVEEIKSKLISQCRELQQDVDSESFDIYTTQLESRTVLIISLPTIIKEKETELSIGISTNENGAVIYNYITS